RSSRPRRRRSAPPTGSHGARRYSQWRIARGASAAPTRPPLRRTPSSWGKPTSTGRPGRRSAGPPDQNATPPPSRGPSGGRGVGSDGGAGSSDVDHAAALVDALDMVDSEVIKKAAIIRYRADDEVGLLADRQRADPVAAAERGGGVERQGRDDFAGQHPH